MAHTPSTIDRLPEEIREKIGKLRGQGRTIDEILAHLNSLDVEVSRSALGRHIKRQASLKERLRSSKEMALALVDRFGEKPDNRLAQLNLELMHTVVLQAMTATEDDEDGEPQPVTFAPQEAMYLASALQKLASAQKTEDDRMIQAEREFAKKAAAAVDRVAKREGGLTKETIAAIKAEILGIAR